MTHIPPELVGKIMEFLDPSQIKNWLIISFINDKSENKSIFCEIRRTYLNLIKNNCIIDYSLYHMYFNIDSILTNKKYLGEKWSFYTLISSNNLIIRKKSLYLRDQLASKLNKLDKKKAIKFTNLTNYIAKYN
tara:strand:+ start:10 stop:408 length:399 start_codon:yes stop_codon:yes gene_type:complete